MGTNNFDVCISISHKRATYGEAKGEYGVANEMIKFLGPIGKKKLLTVSNEIYETGELPSDVLRSVLITLPKNTKAIKCKDFRTISLMSHGIKLLLKVVLKRLEGKLETEISNNQLSFQKESSGMGEMIFALRMLCERCIQIQQNVCLCFADYEKAFDKVRHKTIIKLLNKDQLGHQNIQITRNLYWKQGAGVRVNDELTSWMKIRTEGWGRDVYYHPSYSTCIQNRILENVTQTSGITVGGRGSNYFRYGDSTVFVAICKDSLRNLIEVVNDKCLEYGLRINAMKTKTMVVSKSDTEKDFEWISMTIDGQEVEQCNLSYNWGTALQMIDNASWKSEKELA